MFLAKQLSLAYTSLSPTASRECYCVGEEIECCKKLKECMEQELISSNGEKFRMRSEAQVGRNWGPYKQDKNPEGLKEILV